MQSEVGEIPKLSLSKDELRMIKPDFLEANTLSKVEAVFLLAVNLLTGMILKGCPDQNGQPVSGRTCPWRHISDEVESTNYCRVATHRKRDRDG